MVRFTPLPFPSSLLQYIKKRYRVHSIYSHYDLKKKKKLETRSRMKKGLKKKFLHEKCINLFFFFFFFWFIIKREMSRRERGNRNFRKYRFHFTNPIFLFIKSDNGKRMSNTEVSRSLSIFQSELNLFTFEISFIFLTFFFPLLSFFFSPFYTRKKIIRNSSELFFFL